MQTYADPSFEALASRLERLLDEHADVRPAVRAAYRGAMHPDGDEIKANPFDELIRALISKRPARPAAVAPTLRRPGQGHHQH